MNENPFSGKFIVFEGTDGSGQSTESFLLYDFLKSRGHEIVLTKEPTEESEEGKRIYKILNKEKALDPIFLQELFTKDRALHLKNKIEPLLERGAHVISDRYFFSTFAYGLYDGIDLGKLYKLNNNFILPNIVFFLDVSPDVSIKRIEQRGKPITIFEKKKALEEIRKNYKKILNDFKDKTKIYYINGEKPVEKVFNQIKRIIINEGF